MVRATAGVHNGKYYWEAVIMDNPDKDAHVRLGWSLSKAELQAPVGYDRFSFAFRDVNGLLHLRHYYLIFQIPVFMFRSLYPRERTK